jgi:hypothetical protein
MNRFSEFLILSETNLYLNFSAIIITFWDMLLKEGSDGYSECHI